MNIEEIKTKTLKIIREYSNNGRIINKAQNADYLLSMNVFINDAQFELVKKRPLTNKKFPDVIDDSTDTSKELELDLDLQMIIPYYVAGHVLIDENPPLAEFFLNEFNTKKMNIKTLATKKTTVNVYGGFDCGVK